MRAARREYERFRAALQYFTAVPVPWGVNHSAEALVGAAAYLPVVGVLVGTLGTAVYLLAHVLWPATVAVLLSMAATIVATGAFHEDGLADATDGLGGGFDRPRVLAIMKDSRIGAFGAIAVILVLLLKLHSLLAMPAGRIAGALIGGHALSRFAALGMLTTLPYVRDDVGSRAGPLATPLRARDLVFPGLVSSAPLLLLGWPGLIGIASAALVAVAWRSYIERRIGGYTGDCLGAGQQLTEIAFYLGLLSGPP